jgi:hypothetical protein
MEVLRMIGDMTIPEVVDLSEGVRSVIVSLGGMVLAVAGSALAWMVIRKSLKKALSCDGTGEWDGVALSYEMKRVRQGMEAAARDGDDERFQYWGDRFESFWGPEARAQVEQEIQDEHDKQTWEI